jgi:hypothetical protein
MEKIATLFGEIKRPQKKRQTSERGELLEYFHREANLEWDSKKYGQLTIKRIAVKLAHLKVNDLYYLKSTCEDARRRRGEWAKYFWGSLKVNLNQSDWVRDTKSL